MNRFEIFIEDGLSEDNPYSKEWYSNCGVCDRKLLSGDKTFIVKLAVEVVLPPNRIITKDTTISPWGVLTCSLLCAEVAILQNI